MSKFMLVSGVMATTMVAVDALTQGERERLRFDARRNLRKAIGNLADFGSRPKSKQEPVRQIGDSFKNLGSQAVPAGRRLDMDQFQDVVDLALSDVGDALEQFSVTVAEFKAFSPSELLADLARMALQNRDEEPPRNLRERLARRARDAVIEQAISTLESVGKKQEAVVRDFLEDSAQETQDFVTEEAKEWKEFFDANAAEAADFLEGFNPGEELKNDPWLALDKEFWADNAEELKDFLGENAKEAGDFFMEQVGDAVEFVTDSTESAHDFVDDQLEFILASVDRIVEIAEQFGIKHPALDALEEFSNDPQGFLADFARDLIDDKLIDPLTTKARDLRSDLKAAPETLLEKLAERTPDRKRADAEGTFELADAEGTFDRFQKELDDSQAKIKADLERAQRSILDRLDSDLAKAAAGAGDDLAAFDVTINPSFQ